MNMVSRSLRFTLCALVSWFALAPQMAAAEVCAPDAPRGLFPSVPAGTLQGQCRAAWEGTLPHTRTPTRIMVQDGSTVPSGFADYLRQAIFAADRRSADLGVGIDIGDELTILVTDQGSTPDFGTQNIDDDGACYILFFVDEIAAATEALTLQITAAHEYFHCLQAFTVPEAYDLGLSLPPASHDWIIEGTAEWFGHHVVAGASHVWQRDFETGIGTLGVNNMDYPAWIFFAWMAGSEGADSLLPYINGLPRRRLSDQDVYDSLSAEQWADLARSYAAYRVRSRDGRAINPPNRALIPTETVNEDRVIEAARGLGLLTRQYVTFTSGAWELMTPEEVLAYVSPLDANGDPTGDWAPLAGGTAEVQVACDEADTLMLVTFGADASPYSYEARYLESTCALNCESLPERVDRCLLGTWEYVDYPQQFADSPFMFIMQRLVDDMGGRIEEYTVSPPVHAFYSDGTYSYDQRTRITGVGVEDGATIRGTLNVEAMQDTGRWSSDGRTMLICPLYEEMIATMSVTMSGAEGGSFDQPMNSSGPIEDEPNVTAGYTCDGDTLIIRPRGNPFFANMTEIRARRLSGPID